MWKRYRILQIIRQSIYIVILSLVKKIKIKFDHLEIKTNSISVAFDNFILDYTKTNTFSLKGGINKVNTDTDLRIAFIAEVRKLANKDRTQFDLRKFFAPAMEAMSKVIVERMQILGSANKI